MRIALVLGAGGHPGYPFQLAVMGAVERRLGVDLASSPLVVGTSVGAMTGILLRAGFSATDLLDIAHGRTPRPHAAHLLHDVLDPPGQLPPELPSWQPPAPTTSGMVAALRLVTGRGRRRNTVPAAAASLLPAGRACHQVLGHAADSLYTDRPWPELPTWVVAMRTRDGHRTVFGRDRLAHTVGEAVRATSAIPGWFRPTRVAGEGYVDGGVRSTTNLDLVADFDGSLDLAVVVPPLASADPRTLVVDAPLRWLVNAQLRDEVAAVEAAGIPTVVARPPAAVVRAMQGDPVRMAPDRVARVLDETADWADDWAADALPARAAVSA